MTDYTRAKWCSWCEEVQDTCRVIRLAGKGAAVYACKPCRVTYRLRPIGGAGESPGLAPITPAVHYTPPDAYCEPCTVPCEHCKRHGRQ